MRCVSRADTFVSQSNEDSIYEQDILREPAGTKPWLAYIDFKFRHGSAIEQSFVMERACAQLPRSYKLWKLVSPPHLLTLRLVLTIPSISVFEPSTSKG